MLAFKCCILITHENVEKSLGPIGLAVMTFIGHRQTNNPADTYNHILPGLLVIWLNLGGKAVLCANMSAC